MTEEFLHYLWRFQAIKLGPWLATSGEQIEVLDPGYPNSNSGPDFELARIRIDDELWLGQVEIHIFSAMWYQHSHQKDRAYDNVVLHVVYEENIQVYRGNGSLIPCLELKGKIDEQAFWRFQQVISAKRGLACGASFKAAPSIRKVQMLERCGVERQEARVEEQFELLHKLRGDWQSLIYFKLAESLAGPVNKEAMHLLAQRLPRKLWLKYQSKKQEMQALFLGLSGLLQEAKTAEWNGLRQLFNFMKHKHQLEALAPQCWKYSRMRPYSFPDRRIAQLALLAPLMERWFQSFVEGRSLNFQWPHLPNLWQCHYRLILKSKQQLGLGFSKSLQHQIVINALVPVLFAYAHKTGRFDLKERSLQLLEDIPPELNSITRLYEQLGLSMRSSFDSQAAIQWNKNYCRPKKCLTCTLGNELLKQDSNGTIT